MHRLQYLVFSIISLFAFSTVKAQVVNPQRLQKADQAISQNLPMVNAFLVMQHGIVIHEKYFNGYKADSASRIYSITKSVTGALIGVLMKEKKITSLDQKVSEFLPEYFQDGKNPYAKDITLKHLLTMTSGFDWDERRLDLLQARINNLAKAVNAKPAAKPGEVFNYDDANVCLLSHIISKLSGKRMEDYAFEKLFQPIGIPHKPVWQRDKEGNSVGGYGLFMTPRQVMKFGQLYLYGGIWNGKMIVPQEYAVASTSVQNKGGFPGNTSYGYLWWIDQHRTMEYFYGLGYGGQFVFVVPQMDLVCVIMSDSRLPLEKINDPKYIFTDFVMF